MSFRIVTSAISALSWLVFLLVVNPLLFRFGDLHNWHGNGLPDWATYTATIVAACGFAFSTAMAFGAPRWMLWPCLVLSLPVAIVWALPSVSPLIRGLNYWYHDTPIRGRFFQLWTYLGGAIGMIASALSFTALCFLSLRRKSA